MHSRVRVQQRAHKNAIPLSVYGESDEVENEACLNSVGGIEEDVGRV